MLLNMKTIRYLLQHLELSHPRLRLLNLRLISLKFKRTKVKT
ncbi:hypothetical protein GALL_169600 [mine drainage metagenome]|uniref:Uncharacterized protein n=1 Tax=mine drainage metagenome TaxID=410659 RepID=A0A1J5SH02_9ZZZZ